VQSPHETRWVGIDRPQTAASEMGGAWQMLASLSTPEFDDRAFMHAVVKQASEQKEQSLVAPQLRRRDGQTWLDRAAWVRNFCYRALDGSVHDVETSIVSNLARVILDDLFAKRRALGDNAIRTRTCKGWCLFLLRVFSVLMVGMWI